MIICSCFGTTDREVLAALGPEGHGHCNAGRGCGGCASAIEEIVARVRERESSATRPEDAQTTTARARD